MGMLYFYHYCAVQNNEFGIPAYHHGTVAMDKKVLCDGSYSEFVEKVKFLLLCDKTVIETNIDPVVIVTITLLHHGEYE